MHSASVHSSHYLLVRVAAGDQAAFRLLYNEHWQNIYGVAFVLTRSTTLAEDMVQEVFAKVWLKRDELPKVEKFREWLFLVARNHIFNELRRQRRDDRLVGGLVNYFATQRDGHEQIADPEQALLHKESSRLIRESIERLPAQQQTVYRMARDQGMTREQIAETLGLSTNTVRNHMTQALRSIREYLEKHADSLLLYICLIDSLLR
jgi:RNA polymerase sigma-70 factor (family 1)